MDKISYFDRVLLGILSITLPWTILFASPQLNIGYWGQVEGMIAFTFFSAFISSILIIKIGIKNINIRKKLALPLIIIPFILGICSIISALFQRLPELALYGSPQIGQGAFSCFSLGIFTLLYSIISKNDLWKFILFINLFLVVLLVTIGSFFPLITGIQISFFGFNDWLAIYYTSFFIFLFYVYKLKINFVYKNFIALLIYLFLGPLFWKIENNSAVALWVLVLFAWIFWLFIKNMRIKLIKFIYHPIFFMFIPILLSVIMVLSSYVFWDGVTDQTDIITNQESWIGHLGTLVARGSIIRVLFEHLNSFNAIIFGYGWGSISELLISSFTPEVFYQINTGNRVHFHTHNELFEHLFSIGIIGTFFFILYTYYVFKYSLKYSVPLALLWLLHFCISAFWFQWSANIVIQGLLVSLLIKYDSQEEVAFLSKKISLYLEAKLTFIFVLLSIGLFLLYGAYVGYNTAKLHDASHSSNHLLQLAEDSEISGSCSDKVHDYGKGAFQFSQKFNGFNNYYKDQVIIFGSLNDSDFKVLKWYLCASHEIISKNDASLELINVHINTLSMVSVLPGKLGVKTRKITESYIDLWEEKLDLLFLIAPKRVDQATSLVSYYFKNKTYNGVKRVCNKIDKTGYYQGFCDLSMGAIFLEEGNIEKGMFLIKRAYDKGVLDTKEVDKETSEEIKLLISKYFTDK